MVKPTITLKLTPEASKLIKQMLAEKKVRHMKMFEEIKELKRQGLIPTVIKKTK